MTRELSVPAHVDRGRPWAFGASVLAVLSMTLALLGAPAVAQQETDKPDAAPAAPPKAEPENSSLDAPLFYQLLIGEMEFSAGRGSSAYEVVLDAARRTRDEALFRRAVDIALQSRAGEQALDATR